ncbi:tetratricopeptide repeat protein [Akkermansia sp.]|uniref:tetratricopeptide repeat protein n=1 Tax=Akkermansia sp. TaxID=1872421 RepID=UPI0025B81CCC|nr:tetratricopeptide repeat protein [Akkermansia sp.]MCD8063993.1 tetratricopeptide repeat protein [Akkermansia sp.]
MDEEKWKEELEKWEHEIALNPENAEAYSKRGTVLFVLGRKKEALDSYNRALEINPKYEKAWNNKGVLLGYCGRKKEALDCYIKALQINANHEKIRRNRRVLIGSDEFWDSLSGDSLPDLWSGDEDFNILASREKLKDCSGKDLQSIRHLWVEQYRLLHLLSADLDQVGHYTSTNVFETLLQEQEETKGKATPLLLCSLAAANDPTEGTVFQSLLGVDCMPFQRIHSNLAVLQTSFSSSIGSLNQFRLYGKNNGEEGTGLCLVFNRSFFAGPGETSMVAVKRDQEQSSEEEGAACRKLPLYWVLYYDRDSEHVYYTPACIEYSLNKEFKMKKNSVKKTDLKKVEDIGKSLKRIRDHFKAISKEYQQTALEMLIYLRHLVKDAAFKDEKELRILSLHPYNDHDSSLKVLPGKNCLSVDYLPVIHEEEEYLEKVIAGPKLRDFPNLVDVAKFRLHRLGGKKEVEFCQSQAPLS